MSMQFMFDIRSWIFGFVCSRYKLMISVGPIAIWFSNDKRYYRDMEKAYSEYNKQIGDKGADEKANNAGNA